MDAEVPTCPECGYGGHWEAIIVYKQVEWTYYECNRCHHLWTA